MLIRDFCNAFISFYVQEADATNIHVVFLVEFVTVTGKGFSLQTRSSVRVQCLETVIGQLFSVHFRIMTPAGFSPYLEVFHVFPDPWKSLRIVESANFGW